MRQYLADADSDGAFLPEDCDDNDASIYPQAGDTYGDGVDSDCDGLDCEADADGTNYFLVCPQATTWSDAQATCNAAGYELASIRNDTENALVEALGDGLTVLEFYWLGFNDIDSEGTWLWSDGYSGSYTKWTPGEPNNTGDADCASTYHGLLWDDRGCTDPNATQGFVCGTREPSLALGDDDDSAGDDDDSAGDDGPVDRLSVLCDGSLGESGLP